MLYNQLIIATNHWTSNIFVMLQHQDRNTTLMTTTGQHGEYEDHGDEYETDQDTEKDENTT